MTELNFETMTISVVMVEGLKGCVLIQVVSFLILKCELATS